MSADRPARAPRAAWLLGAAVGAALSGCSPYPDDGEFLAGVIYAGNFLNGVKKLDTLPAVGRGVGARSDGLYPYYVVATTSGSTSSTAVSASSPAASPFWTTSAKRNPLDRSSVQPVYFFDSSCAAPPDYHYDGRLDLIPLDRQFPIFSDIPENLSANNGKAGRTAAYSAIVEVIHVTASGAMPCQSIKRFDTAQGRLGGDGDLTEGRHEFRLFQIIDPAIAVAPIPYQLGFYNQLVVPYIDMGPVPMEPDGKSFRTMPIYKGVDSTGKATGSYALILGQPDEAGPAFSPICRDFNVTLGTGMMLPLDASDPSLAKATKTENLTSCLICRPVDTMGNLACPAAETTP